MATSGRTGGGVTAGELTVGRNFEVYRDGMDAGLAVKIDDLAPASDGLPAGSRLVDLGCGTATLLGHLASQRPDLQLVGVDTSPTLRQIAVANTARFGTVAIVDGKLTDLPLPDGYADAVVLSSVLHEVFSYNGYRHEAVTDALRHAVRILRPGGRLAIRDGVSPDDADQPVWLRVDDPTDQLMFTRFAGQFRPSVATPGIAYTCHTRDGSLWVNASLGDVYEFLSKKEYWANFDCEIHEQFGVYTLDGWRQILTGLGLEVVSTRAYVHPWVEANSLNGRVALFAGDQKTALPWPATTIVCHATRPH